MGYDAEIVGPRMNPDLTPELERETAFFRKWGYLIVDDALTPSQIEQLRDALDETFGRHGETFTHQLLEEDGRFAFLLDNPPVLAGPGQADLFDGWLFHRGAANQSERNRRVCLMCYQNAWMKSREPFDGPRVSAMRENGTKEQKLLLGAIDRW